MAQMQLFNLQHDQKVAQMMQLKHRQSYWRGRRSYHHCFGHPVRFHFRGKQLNRLLTFDSKGLSMGELGLKVLPQVDFGLLDYGFR